MHNRLLLNVRSIILKQRLFASGHADPKACRARSEARFDREGARSWTRRRLGATPGLIVGQTTITSCFQRSGIYLFLISFTSVYYLSNAPLLLGHYDLGWHLAAGDLIREQGNIPLQDPWSFTSAARQWYNLSWLWDVIASVLFQYAKFSGLILFVVASGAAIVGYLASICLRSGASAVPSAFRFFSRVCSTPLLRPPRIAISPLRPTCLPCCFASCSTGNV